MMPLVLSAVALAVDLTCQVRGVDVDTVDVACLPALEAKTIERYNDSYSDYVAYSLIGALSSQTYDTRALYGRTWELKQSILQSDAFRWWFDETGMTDEGIAFRKFLKQYRRIKRARVQADRQSGW